MKTRNFLLWSFTVLVLLTINGLVFQKEQQIANGQIIFLKIVPVDPRSLLQGDYMQLWYVISAQIENNGKTNGLSVIRLDENNVAQYIRLYDSQTPLTQGELLLRYRRKSSGGVTIGPGSFFFQEGHAHYYAGAQYGEIRLSESGDALLVGLRGPDLEILGPP